MHIGFELLGAAVFFIAAFLFFEAYLLKRDGFSAARTAGFFLAGVWHIIHAVGTSARGGIDPDILLIAGLGLIAASYLFERLPPRPRMAFPVLFAAPFAGYASGPWALLLLVIITLALIKRYIADIDRQLKWMSIGFGFLSFAYGVTWLVPGAAGSGAWIFAHALEGFAFFALGRWAWQLITMRAREEVIIVFISAAFFISLLVTTSFSVILMREGEHETRSALHAAAKTAAFYTESLLSRSLATAHIIAQNEPFQSAFRDGDMRDLESIGGDLLTRYGGEFLIALDLSGNVVMRVRGEVRSGENISEERIARDALEGIPGAVVARGSAEGFSVRAAAPLIVGGAIRGAVVTGYRIDAAFLKTLKDITGFDAVHDPGEPAENAYRAEAVSADSAASWFRPAGEGSPVLGIAVALGGNTQEPAYLVAYPDTFFADAGSANRLTLLMAFAISLALLFPLYRFAVSLGS